MYKPSLAVPLAALALVCASGALSQESVETAIRELVKQYEVAYNAGDADAVAAIYAVDGTHTYVLGVTHCGRLEIANGPKELFAGPFKGTRLTINPLHIRALSSDVAEAISVSGAFWVYASMGVVTPVFVWKGIPETKGRSPRGDREDVAPAVSTVDWDPSGRVRAGHA
jgi:uncharacterized protein (TIGR02246 family)